MVRCSRRGASSTTRSSSLLQWPMLAKIPRWHSKRPMAGVRHEAPHDRVGGRAPPGACRSRPLKLEAAWPRRREEGREQPPQRRDELALTDSSGPASKTERCTYAGTSGGTPSRSQDRLEIWWMAGIAVRCDSLQPGGTASTSWGVGGHGDVLRDSRGQACRGKAGHRSRQPVCGERGNRPLGANLSAIRVGSGKARRLLMARGRGGGSVVVRGRESRPHGEGTQRACSTRTGRSGGRW